jgi:hypothetical protein
MSTGRCESCGYTEADAKIHGDHRLCKNAGNAPWERRKDNNVVNKPIWNGLTTDGLAAEDQQSIALWAEQTFGLSTQLRAATRMNEEVAELLAKLSNPSASNAKIIEEVADIQIVLYVLAGRLHMDLQAEVEKKMKVNRGRQWQLDGSGCGQHVD